MSLILIVSITIRLLAMSWSIVLLRRIRDWRMGLLTAMLGMMALRQSLTLMKTSTSWSISLTANLIELPGLIVSLLAFAAVIFLEHIIFKEEKVKEALAKERETLTAAVSSLRRYVPVALVLFLGVVLSVLAFITVNSWERDRIEQEFIKRAGNQVAALERGIATIREVVLGIEKLYAASQVVERHEFREFVKGSLARHSEIQALEWIPRVREAERAAYKEAARRDGLTDFQITERETQGNMVRAERRKEYFPVYYVEPLEGNEAAVGFDLASNLTRLEALNKARDTGEMVATGRITLVQEDGKQFGFLMFQPIYRNNAPHDTVEERRENLLGFALGVFRIGDMVEKSLKGVDAADIDVHLYDDSAGPDNRFLYLHLTTQEEKEVLSGMHWRTTIDVADRQWSLLFHPEPEFLATERTWHPKGALLGGLLLTALMVAYLLNAIRHTVRLQSEVIERRRAEEETRLLQALTMAISEAESFLSALNTALRMVCETTGWAIGEAWIPSPDGTFLEYSGAFYSKVDGADALRKESDGLTFSEGIGLPGRSWSSKQPEWMLDVSREEEFLRKPSAGELGIKTGIAIPVIAGDEVAAVLVFFVLKLRAEDEQQVKVISAVASQLGLVVQRKRAEEELAQERQNLEVTVEQRTEELRQSLEELETANIQLLEADRHKSRFLSSMSHELRTPLNAVIGFADLLKGQHYGPINEEQEEFVTHIETSGKHLLELISDLLDIAKIDAGKLEVHIEPFSLDETIRASTSMMRGQFNKKGLVLDVEVADELGEPFLGDERLTKQILFNLLSNSVKFTEAGGNVSVRAGVVDGRVRVSVSDTGIGIPQEEQEKIFSEFHQVDDPRIRQHEGTGIGLALTRRLVDLLEGEISVESEPGKGSTFTFTLPLRRPVAAPGEGMEGERRAMSEVRGRRILVAEDNEVNLAVVLKMLATQDHEVAVARNGQEAVELAKSFRPELILMDIRMPVMDGLEATRQIRQMPEFATLPIIALTASVGEDSKKRCLEAGCTAHLAKPVQSSELFAALETWTEEVSQ